jgi:signal transduction histidine kinase
MKQDRLGLTMIVATLAAIALIVAAMLFHQGTEHEKRVRAQGIGLTQSLASLPFDQLANAPERAGILQNMVRVQRSPDFAYGLLVSPNGGKLVEVSVASLPPDTALPQEPAGWFGERELRSPEDGRRILEFHGPVMRDGNLAGFIRIGYFAAPPLLGLEQVSFSALLALPVFLLTPLFYFLMRHEMKPLAALGRQIQDMAQSVNAPAASLPPNLQMQDFARRFGEFLHATETRIRELEAERLTSVTSNRLLAYKQSKVEAVLHSLPQGVLVMDDTCIVTFANAKIEPLLGTTRDQIIGHAPQKWCGNRDVLAFLVRHHGQCNSTGHATQAEIAFDGATPRQIALASYPLFSPQDHGNIFGTLVVVRDVTQEHLAKNAGAEFVAHVSHELKTPLNTLAAWSEVLMDVENLTDALRIESANVIHDEVERMASLINNLLNISKLETGALALESQRVNLRELLRDSFDSLRQGALGKGIEFRIEVPPNLGLAALDKDLFRIALNNLLSNAIKYNVPGGKVTLSAEESGDQHLEIFVRDSGIGIPAEHRERIFDKYYRVAESAADGIARSGHGLGLYLAKQIVELHHGTIGVRSEPGKGTEFCIRIRKQTTPFDEAIAA